MDLGEKPHYLPAIDPGHQNHYHVEDKIGVEDSMPRAKNLREAYNNFYVEPLKSDQEFAEFYVSSGHLSYDRFKGPN